MPEGADCKTAESNLTSEIGFAGKLPDAEAELLYASEQSSSGRFLRD